MFTWYGKSRRPQHYRCPQACGGPYRMGERGDTPHMPLGIKQYLQVPTSTILEEDKCNLPHASDILQ